MSGSQRLATAELALSEADWPRFRSLLAESAAQDGWRWRDGSQPAALGGSLDRECGAHVAYKQWRWAREERATLYLLTPTGEGRAVAALLNRLMAEWPGTIVLEKAHALHRPL